MDLLVCCSGNMFALGAIDAGSIPATPILYNITGIVLTSSNLGRISSFDLAGVGSSPTVLTIMFVSINFSRYKIYNKIYVE